MIVQNIWQDGRLVHTKSDLGFKILQVETGIVYDEADDINPCPYTYEETDEPIEPIIEPIEEVTE